MTSQTQTAAPSLWRDRTFAVAGLIAVIVALGFGLIVPVLPLFATHFGVGVFAAGLVVSVFSAVRLVSNVYTGALSDRIGGRSAIAGGAFIVGVSSLAAAFAPNYWSLVALRGVGGFGSALFFNALMALVIERAPAHRRGQAVGMLQGAFLFGISVGPSVGGVLAAPLGLHWPFVIYGVMCGIAGLVAMLLLPREDRGAPTLQTAEGSEGEPIAAAPSTQRAGWKSMWRSAKELCADRTFAIVLGMMLASRWAGTGVRFSTIPVFADQVVHADARVIGFALTLAALTHMILVVPAGRLIDLRGRRSLGAPAHIAFAGMVAVLGFATTTPLFLAAMALYGIGTGLTSVVPPAVVGDVTPPAKTGTAIGVLNTAGDLGSVLGPLVTSLLAERMGYGWGFGASAALLLLAGLWGLRMRETLPVHSAKAPDSGATAPAR